MDAAVSKETRQSSLSEPLDTAYPEWLYNGTVSDIDLLVDDMQCLAKDIRDLVDHVETVSMAMNCKQGSRGPIKSVESSEIVNSVSRLSLDRSLLNRCVLGKTESLDSEANIISTPDDSDCSEYWIDYGWSYLQQGSTGCDTARGEQTDDNDNYETKNNGDVTFTLSCDSLMSVDSSSSKDEGEFELYESLISSLEGSLRSGSPPERPSNCCQDNHDEYCSVYENMMDFYLETIDSDGEVSDDSNFDEPDVTPRKMNSSADSSLSLTDIGHTELVFSDISSCCSRDSPTGEKTPPDLDATLTNLGNIHSNSVPCVYTDCGDVNPWKDYSVTVTLADTGSESSLDIM